MTTPTQVPTTLDEIRDTVRARYGQAALRASEGAAACCTPAPGSSGCCGTTSETWDPITADLYEAGQTAGIPAEALLASLGCGNPTALADLRRGETVLDLAMQNREKAGATNVEFLKGHIEAIPLPSSSVDVIISNCVINLSGDKRKVLAEAFRVLRPGGRFAVSDIVTRGELPEPVRRSMALWSGCVSGALDEQEFITLLKEAGFENPTIEPTRVYTREDALALLDGTGLDPRHAEALEGKFLSGFVRATKPGKAKTPLAQAAPARACGCDDSCCS